MEDFVLEFFKPRGVFCEVEGFVLTAECLTSFDEYKIIDMRGHLVQANFQKLQLVKEKETVVDFGFLLLRGGVEK